MASTDSATGSWSQIAQEHCYPKLMACRSSLNQSFPTCYLFSREHKSEAQDSGVESEEEEEKDVMVDVESYSPPPELPYQHSKVVTIMNECTAHMNLIRIPPDNPDIEQERLLAESSYQQRSLLHKILGVLQEEHLARLAFSAVVHEPIKRRLHCDKSAQQVRKILADIKWDGHLTSWLHRALLRVLSPDMLPIYLDILQTLKAKCPVLVENMIHYSSLGEGTNEALRLLLKRPWNPVAGMASLDKHVLFESPIMFVTIPHTSRAVGGRRWRAWHSQLSSIGKVCPVILPDQLLDSSHVGDSVREFVEHMVVFVASRIQELKAQNPHHILVLIGWSIAGRIAAKVAEIEKVCCILCLGLPHQGLHHHWEVTKDVFRQCSTPTMFVVGSSGPLSSVQYLEELRSQMQCPTGLVVVDNGDDLLRLSVCDKEESLVTQCMVDRCIQEHFYDFLVYILPCSLPPDGRLARKRKISHSVDESANSFLSAAVPCSPIVLNAATSAAAVCSEDKDGGKNSNLNNSNNPLIKTILGLKSSSRSSTPSPISLSNGTSDINQTTSTRSLMYDLPKIGRPPKPGRSRSRSTTSSGDVKKKKQTVVRSRSTSSEVPTTPSSRSLCVPPVLANQNSNNSNESSPNSLLTISQHCFIQPMPVTPPKNPYEDPNQISDPKTLKCLQLH